MDTVSSLSTIGKLMFNIYKYGNCRMCIEYMETPNAKFNRILEFFVDERGKLNAIGKIEMCNKAHSNDTKADDTSAEKKIIEIVKFDNIFDLIDIISIVVFHTFFKGATISHAETPTQTNTTRAVNVIYQLASPMMFKLSDEYLTTWFSFKNDDNIKNTFSKIANYSTISTIIYDPIEIIEEIEGYVNNISSRLDKIYENYSTMQSDTTDKFYDDCSTNNKFKKT